MAATVSPTVHPYTAAQLRDLLIGASAPARHRNAADKLQIDYLSKYLSTLNAKTIIIESGYVDHDFLEDYSAYYVRCFKHYERTCQRLHFFSEPFTFNDWKLLLEGTASALTTALLNDSYLGFVVARPLPLAVIGRTCLEPFRENETDGRAFPTVRNYDVNLCGIKLDVKTLAFQEQDEVAAKCATAALWSVFQGTAMLFQHAIPSPVEITKQATVIAPFGGRAIPNLGLTDEQMGYAIRQVGLEPLIISAANTNVLKATAYAYLRGRIPLLLNLLLRDPVSKDVPSETHEVAITGYRLGAPVGGPSLKDVTPLLAHKIDCLYVHDDRVGPFARMSFDKSEKHLTTEWPSSDDKAKHLIAIPTNLIIPVYHKIRIPFQKIYDEISHLHGLLVNVLLPQFKEHATVEVPTELEWDIHLTTVNSFKAEFHANKTVGQQQKRNVLERCLPRFLWRSTAASDGKVVLDLLFDATDIEHGELFICPVHADSNLVPLLKLVAQNNAIPPEYQKTSAPEILNWFTKNDLPSN